MRLGALLGRGLPRRANGLHECTLRYAKAPRQFRLRQNCTLREDCVAGPATRRPERQVNPRGAARAAKVGGGSVIRMMVREEGVTAEGVPAERDGTLAMTGRPGCAA